MASPLKHNPHQARCPSEARRALQYRWAPPPQASRGPTQPLGTITLSKGRASSEKRKHRRKHRRKPEGEARLRTSGSRRPADIAEPAKARAERGISAIPQPQAGATGAAKRRSRRQQRPSHGSRGKPTGSQECRQPRGPQASVWPDGLRRLGGPGDRQAGRLTAGLTKRPESIPGAADTACRVTTGRPGHRSRA